MKQKFLLSKYIFSCIFVLSWIGSCVVTQIQCHELDHVILLVVILPAFPEVTTITTETDENVTTIKTTTETFTTMRKHYFEGVDWTVHPSAYRERNDCTGHYIRCIRRTTPLIPVCGFNIYTMYYEDYYSNCEIEIENCLFRVAHQRGIYGGVWWQNKIYHNGELYNCKYYFRRSSSPEELEELYFRGDKNKVLDLWGKDNYQSYINGPVQSEVEYDEVPNFE